MSKRLALLPLALLLALSLSSCDALLYEKQAYALCMALDTSSSGIKLTLQLPEGGQAAQSSGESAQGASGYTILTVEAQTLSDALRLAEACEPYPIHYGQMRLIVLGGGLSADGGLEPLLSELLALRGMRETATVASCIGEASELIRNQKPELGMRLSKHIDVTLKALRSQGLIPSSSLEEVVRMLRQDRGDPLLALCAVNASVVKQNQPADSGASGGGDQSSGGGASGGAQSSKRVAESVAAFNPNEAGGGSSFAGGTAGEATTGDAADQAAGSGASTAEELLDATIMAGTLPRTGSNPIEVMGAAVVANGRVAGLLSAREMELVAMAASRATLRCAVGADALQLQVLLPSELMPVAGEIDAVLAKLQSLDCDALAFSVKARRAFALDSDWDAYRFEERYKDAERFVGNGDGGAKN